MVLWEAKAVGLTLFLPKRLEKYNAGLSGCGDMVEALSKARKAERCEDSLADYNQAVLTGIRNLF